MSPTIIIVDDHVMICRALRRLFQTDFGYQHVETAATCAATLKSLKKRPFTHLILDIGLPDGSALEMLPAIQGLYPQLRIMIYSAKPLSIYEPLLKQYGIAHYLSKKADEMESIRGFRAFLADLKEVSSNLSPQQSPFSCLTERQLQVMHYFLKGFSGKEIAEALNVTQSTISTLKSQLLERTATNNLIELSDLASLYGLT